MDLTQLPRTLELCRSEKKGQISLRFVDQTQLPANMVIHETSNWRRVVKSIKALEVRGAPAIGLAGASAVVLAIQELLEMPDETLSKAHLQEKLAPIAQEIAHARPTAINLSWATNKLMTVFVDHVEEGADGKECLDIVYDQVKLMEGEDEAANRKMGALGADLLPGSCAVLTHCNAGSLATGYFGTALGVVYSAAQQRKIKRVFIDETRPVGQGARLTAWELSRVGVDGTLICDNMAASLMAQGRVDVVIVGADRICRNGDVANKIGTYNLAVLAMHHHIPFYVVAPLSTFDITREQGDQIPIEERDRKEVSKYQLDGIEIYNPAFDVTPAELITAIITETGVYLPSDISECTQMIN